MDANWENWESCLTACPHAMFDAWFAAAAAQEGQDVNAMTLATVAADGMPQARTVLLKAHEAGTFTFYTNAQSRKGQALAAHPRAALLFFWRVARRQALIEGTVRQMTSAESEPYYQSRPRGSRIGAWASAQSRPLAAPEALRRQVADAEARFAGQEPHIPPYWRGYCLAPTRIEFWQEGEYRLHKRLAFLPDGAGGWRGGFLQP